jgi:hypothetical protein
MNTEIQTEVYRKGPQRYNMVGQSLPQNLTVTQEAITPGLAKRLHNYAKTRMTDSGFEFALTWKTTVYTVEAERPSSERSYCVAFLNDKGGRIEVHGILTRRGWPFLDHGIGIDENQS